MINPPSSGVYAEARRRLDALAKPTGALGRLEDLAAWVAACQGTCPPRPLDRVRAVILAGDHGVSHNSVSAYPREITPVMVRAFVAGVAGANSLARQHGVALRVLDLGVDDDLEDLPAEVSVYHLGPSDPIDQADGLTEADCRQALRTGEAIAQDELSAGADLLIIGDMGIGNTTPAAALVAATFGLRAEEVVGRGSGVDDDRLRRRWLSSCRCQGRRTCAARRSRFGRRSLYRGGSRAWRGYVVRGRPPIDRTCPAAGA